MRAAHAHAPTYRPLKSRMSQMSGNEASDIKPKLVQCGQPNITSPLIAHTNIGRRKCWLMGLRHQAEVSSRWAAQAHDPAYRPFKSRMSQMLANGLETSGPSGLEVGSPSPRSH